jgi:homoserine O-acetyltransferase
MVAIRPWRDVAGFHPALGGPAHPDAVMSPACAVFESAPARHAGIPFQHHIGSSPTDGRGTVTIDLSLRHAGLHRIDVHYEIQGDPASPLVIVAGGISGTRHVAGGPADSTPGWWDDQIGDGLPLDPRHHCILAIDWVGADGLLDAPIDTADQADAIRAVLDALSLPRVALFVGCSYGAMVALQFATLHGDRVDRVVCISGCDRAHPYSSAARALQRRAVALGSLQCDTAAGLALARELAMLTYRTPEEFSLRFDAAPTLTQGRVRCAAEDYLDHCGQRFAGTFSSTGFLRLSESLDLHVVAAEDIRVPVTVVAVAEDRLVPLADAARLATRLGDNGALRVLHSPYGHDAFLKETAAIGVVLRDALHACARGVR